MTQSILSDHMGCVFVTLTAKYLPLHVQELTMKIQTYRML